MTHLPFHSWCRPCITRREREKDCRNATEEVGQVPEIQRARKARSSGHEPNVGPDENGTHFMSVVDGGDEHSMGVENSQFVRGPTYHKS